MKLKQAVIGIALLISAASASPVLADLTVNCNGGICDTSPSPAAALFNESKFAPGQSVTKAINVNNSAANDDCALIIAGKNPTDPDSLSEVLFTVIKDGATEVYGTKTLKDFFSAGNISLGTVSKSASKIFDWTVTFASSAGDSFQSKETKFDFDLAFTCGVPPPVPPGAPSPTSPATPPTCTDTTPGTPTSFGAVLGANPGQVVLSWTAPTPPYSYFLVTYSDSPDWPPKWGNPNVGDVTSYTVSGLGSGTYWFWVRAGNGCQPGSYVGPTSSLAVVGIPGVAGPAAGFAPGVLGEQENLNSGAATRAAGQLPGRVKGASSFPWWIFLLTIGGVSALLMISFFLHRRYNDH